MLNVTRGVGRSGSAILILTGIMAVPAAAVEVKVPVPQVHITVAPPPVHTLTPQLHTVTPTVKGNVLNAVKGLQQNTLKGGGTTGGANIRGSGTAATGRDSSSNSTTVRAATLKTVVGSKSTTATGGAALDVTGTHSSAPGETFDPVYQNLSRASGASPKLFPGAGSVASFGFNKIDPAGKASVVFVPAVQIQKIVDKSLAPFLQGDINRPFVIGAIYNGTGPVVGNVPFNVGAGTIGSNVSPSTSAGSGPENPLYRVQIRQGSAGGFNWSRD
jgi:hypothetical protein